MVSGVRVSCVIVPLGTDGIVVRLVMGFRGPWTGWLGMRNGIQCVKTVPTLPRTEPVQKLNEPAVAADCER